MQSTRHDPNLALHAGSRLPGHVLDVVVLTADPGLFATLRDASGPEHAVWHAPGADAAVDLLVGGRCAILIADLSALRGDAASFFDRLHAQFPELVLMATGRREEEGAVASLVSGGLIYRLLHKPVSPARAGLFIAAAARRYQELRNLEPAGMATVKTIAAARPNLKIAISALLLVALAVGAYFAWRWIETNRASPEAQPASLATAPEEQIATLMGRAQIAFARDQLSEPRGDNALEHYRSVLALDASHTEAAQGVARVLAALEARVAAALQAGDAVKSLAALSALQEADPQHPRLDALRVDLITLSRSAAALRPGLSEPAATPSATATAAFDAPAAQRTVAANLNKPAPERLADAPRAKAAAPSKRQVASRASGPTAAALKNVSDLREKGALIAPAGANAFEALAVLRAAYPAAAEVQSETQRLAFALLEHARAALLGNQLDQSAILLDRVEALVPGMATTRALRLELDAALAERAFKTNIVQAATLKRVRETLAEYPRDARRDGVEGWVDVEFTIAPDGSTRDLIVRDAMPREVFEQAALDSMRRWRFEPIIRDGRAVRQRAVLRVRFVLE